MWLLRRWLRRRFVQNIQVLEKYTNSRTKFSWQATPTSTTQSVHVHSRKCFTFFIMMLLCYDELLIQEYLPMSDPFMGGRRLYTTLHFYLLRKLSIYFSCAFLLCRMHRCSMYFPSSWENAFNIVSNAPMWRFAKHSVRLFPTTSEQTMTFRRFPHNLLLCFSTAGKVKALPH